MPKRNLVCYLQKIAQFNFIFILVGPKVIFIAISGIDLGVEGDGRIYPLQYLTRGDGLCNHPPILWKVNNILPYLYKYSDKINRFYSKNGWYLLMQNFIKLFSQNAKFWSVRPKELFSCKNTKFSSFSGGTSPSDTPCARKHAIGADAPPNHPPKTDLRPWLLSSVDSNLIWFLSEYGQQ